MGSKLREDFIGALSHSSGVISLGPTLITIRGQQYYALASSLNISGLTANTLYFVYAVPLGSSFSLQYSTSIPSVYRIGVPQSALVGAFYSNNFTTPAFAAFVNIDGVPRTEWWATNNTIPTALIGSVSNPAFGTMSHNLYRLKRSGEDIEGEWNMRQTAAGSPGSGFYIVTFPFPILESYYRTNQTDAAQADLGTISIREFVPGSWRINSTLSLPANNTQGMFGDLGGIQSGSTVVGDWGTPFVPFGGSGQQLRIGIKYKYKVSGWSNTPLKDL